MEKQAIDFKKQAIVAKQQKNIPAAVELLKRAKLVEKDLEEPKEELLMLTEMSERAQAHALAQSNTRGGGGGGGRDSPDLLETDGLSDVISASISRPASSRQRPTSSAGASAGASASASHKSSTRPKSSKPVPVSASSSAFPPTAPATTDFTPRDSGMSSCSVISNLTDFTPFSVNEQVFSHLQAAINEALKLYLADAKNLKDSDKQKAAKRFSQYKAMKDELGVLSSRKMLPYEVSPPLFQWHTLEQKYFYQDLTLAETDLKLEIQSVRVVLCCIVLCCVVF
jgi:hypothetical protein